MTIEKAAVDAFTLKEIEKFDKETLTHTETEDKNTLPSLRDIYGEMLPADLKSKKELNDIRDFARNRLKKVNTDVKVVLPSKEAINEESFHSRAEVIGFDHSKLKKVETDEKSNVPTVAELRSELLPEDLPTRPELEALQGFVKDYLKHVEYVEKRVLPTKEDIDEESKNSMAEVKKFDASSLKPVATDEKNILPSIRDIWQEMLPENLPPKVELEALKSFSERKLTHVDTLVKGVLPTAADIAEEGRNTFAEVKKFDKSNLKHVEVKVSNTLPTGDCLTDETLPEYLPKQELDALAKLVRGASKNTAPLVENESLHK